MMTLTVTMLMMKFTLLSLNDDGYYHEMFIIIIAVVIIVLLPHLPLESVCYWLFRACVIRFVNTMSYKPFVGISRNVHLQCSLAQSNELIRFYVQKVKSQAHVETTSSQISTLGGIFSPISGIYLHIFMKLITATQRLLITVQFGSAVD